VIDISSLVCRSHERKRSSGILGAPRPHNVPKRSPPFHILPGNIVPPGYRGQSGVIFGSGVFGSRIE
jgi:hypothetical protein